MVLGSGEGCQRWAGSILPGRAQHHNPALADAASRFLSVAGSLTESATFADIV